jgi:hypothetical protein
MKLSRICLGLSCAALLLLILSGPILRLGLVHFRFALLLFAGALLLALLGSLLSLVALAIPRLRGDRVRPLSTALVLGLLVMVGPAIFVQKASRVPAIHDITTDTVNPPAFVDVIPIRQAAGADNPPEYPGASVAAQQKAAYPDIAPRDLTVPPDQAFARAVTAARAWAGRSSRRRRPKAGSKPPPPLRGLVSRTTSSFAWSRRPGARVSTCARSRAWAGAM